MTTLLEQANMIELKKGPKKEYSQEEIELAIAWAKEEITLTQASKALGRSAINGNVLYFFAVVFKKAIQEGYLIENKK